MSKYSLETKIKSVEHYMEGLTSSYTNYDIRFKMDVISYMNETGASYLESAARFNIPSAVAVP